MCTRSLGLVVGWIAVVVVGCSVNLINTDDMMYLLVTVVFVYVVAKAGYMDNKRANLKSYS